MLRRFNTYLLYVFGTMLFLTAGCGVEVTSEDVPAGEAIDTSDDSADPSQGFVESTLPEHVVRKIYINGIEVKYGLLGKTITKKSRFHHLRLGLRKPHGAFRLLLTDVKQHKQTQQDRLNWLNNILCQIFGIGNCNYEVRKVLVAVKTLDIRNEAGEYIRIVDFGDEGRIVDLMNFQNGGFSDLGALSLAPGNYLGMRLTLKEQNLIQVAENNNNPVIKPLLMQSSAHATIELQHAFTVADLQLTMLKLDFDVQSSITRNFWGTYYIRPYISVLDTVASDVIEQLITKNQGGTLEVHGEISLHFPANAVAADTLIRLKPTFKLLPHTTPGIYTLGQEYEIQPPDLQLESLATVSIMSEPIYIDAQLIDENSLGIHQRNQQQMVALESQIGGDGMVSAHIDRLGTFAMGAQPQGGHVASAACERLAGLISIAPAAQGLDSAYLASACARHSQCYTHGMKTYGKSAAQCNEDFHDDAMQRCENLCIAHADGGSSCSQVDIESASSALKSLLGIYGQCQQLANDMHTAAVATTAQAYPGDAASTCHDYDGAGVSCVPATCSLSVDPASIPPYTPTALNFQLQVQGSVQRVIFDGTVAYVHEGLPTPVNLSIMIAEDGRELTEARAFTAVLEGPGMPNGASTATCSVVVQVSEPPACILTIEPNAIPLGGDGALLTLRVLPGHDMAQTDLRQEGVFRDAGLSAPDANGWRYFTSTANPAASRSYTARVWDSAGNMHTCSDYLQVIP